MRVLLKSKKTDMIRSLSGILSILTVMMFLFVNSSFSQSRKEIKKYGIRSTESVITEYVGGKEVTHTDSFEKYDNDGNIIEEVEYCSKIYCISKSIGEPFILPDDEMELMEKKFISYGQRKSKEA